MTPASSSSRTYQGNTCSDSHVLRLRLHARWPAFSLLYSLLNCTSITRIRLLLYQNNPVFMQNPPLHTLKKVLDIMSDVQILEVYRTGVCENIIRTERMTPMELINELKQCPPSFSNVSKATRQLLQLLPPDIREANVQAFIMPLTLFWSVCISIMSVKKP